MDNADGTTGFESIDIVQFSLLLKGIVKGSQDLYLDEASAAKVDTVVSILGQVFNDLEISQLEQFFSLLEALQRVTEEMAPTCVITQGPRGVQ